MSITADPNNIKALAFDLDGTLLTPDSVLSKRSLVTLEKCKKRGLQIIIATGRTIESAEPFRKEIRADGPMIFLNGAVVADMDRGGVIKTTYMSRDAAEFCVDLAREMGIYCQLYIDNNDNVPVGKTSRITLFAERDLPERKFYHEKTGVMAELRNLKEVLGRPDFGNVIKTMFLVEPEVQAEIRPILDKHIGENVYIVQTYRSYLEILSKSASKGKALAYVMESLSLRSDEVIAFGDEENDIPMFETAAYSAAPSSAKESVKARAGMVIGSNADDGVAEFLERFFRF